MSGEGWCLGGAIYFYVFSGRSPHIDLHSPQPATLVDHRDKIKYITIPLYYKIQYLQDVYKSTSQKHEFTHDGRIAGFMNS